MQLDANPGTLLVVSMPWAHPTNWLDLPAAAVRPATVASAITSALAKGWQPAHPGAPFALALDEATAEGTPIHAPGNESS